MDCPYSNHQLSLHDSYGYFAQHQSGEKVGDIYKCEVETCEAYEQKFYTDYRGELKEGYPV
jgi:hypothetical protein